MGGSHAIATVTKRQPAPGSDLGCSAAMHSARLQADDTYLHTQAR